MIKYTELSKMSLPRPKIHKKLTFTGLAQRLGHLQSHPTNQHGFLKPVNPHNNNSSNLQPETSQQGPSQSWREPCSGLGPSAPLLTASCSMQEGALRTTSKGMPPESWVVCWTGSVDCSSDYCLYCF